MAIAHSPAHTRSTPPSPTRNQYSVEALLERTKGPEAPLAFFLVGYPLWWLLGVTQVAAAVMCVIMVGRMLRGRGLRAPRGFGWWLLFLAVMLVGALVTQVPVPGALPADNANRYLTWALRLFWYLEVTVVLLYLADARQKVSATRVARILGFMFVTIVAGGLVGVLLPTLRLTSVTELFLPDGLSSNAFVRSLVHPVLAERQVYLDVNYRPSAPFPFANEWGLNFAVFLPFFLTGWCTKASGWRRYAAAPILLLGLIPVVYSLNRGLWALLLIGVGITVIRAIMRGYGRRLVLPALLLVPVVIAAVMVSPLGTTLSERFSGHNSNAGRINLSVLAVKGMLETSPVIGMGTTRPTEGTFYSIAGGNTPDCPTCAPPAFGTQGFLWSLLFGNGVVGFAACLLFFGGVLWRHRRARSPIDFACLMAIGAFLLTAPIYDWSITTGVAVMAAAALLVRRDPVGETASARLLPRAPIAIVCVVLGLVTAVAWEYHQGRTYDATAEVWLPPANQTVVPTPLGKVDQAVALHMTDQESTLDTEARFLFAPGVLKSTASSRAKDLALGDGRGELTVAAHPNTRILLIRYSSGDPERARHVAQEAGDRLIQLRADRLAAERKDLVDKLTRQAESIASAETPATTAVSTLETAHGNPSAIALLRAQQAVVDQSLRTTTQQLRTATVAPTHSTVVRVTSIAQRHRWNVPVSTGIILGLLLAIALERLARPGRLSERAARGPMREGGLPTVRVEPSWSIDRIRRETERDITPGAVIWFSAEPHDEQASQLADALDRHEVSLGPRVPTSRESAVLVSRRKTRRGTLDRARHRLEGQGVEVAGLVILV